MGQMRHFIELQNECFLIKLRTEHPAEWDKMVDPLLFAYREVPNKSDRFSPFELTYGRHPPQTLQALWTGDISQEEVKTTYDYVNN